MRTCFSALTLCVALSCLPALGATIVSYDFDGGADPDLNPDTVAANTMASVIGPDNVGVTSNGSYASQVLRLTTGTTSTNRTAAFNNDTYVEFSVTVDPGYTLDLSSFDFDGARGGGGTPRTWHLFVDADGDGFELVDDFVEEAEIPTVRPTLTSFSADLTGAAFQGLAGTVDFRLYVSAPSNGSSLEFDDFLLDGTVVAPVPEPSTIAIWSLLGVAAIGFVACRRRK